MIKKPVFPTYRTFTGAEIRAIRKFFRYSQAKFARLFPVSVGSIKGWEAGTRNQFGSSNTRLQQLDAWVQQEKAAQEKAFKNSLKKAGLCTKK